MAIGRGRRKTKAERKQDRIADNKEYAYTQMKRFLWKYYKFTLDDIEIYVDSDKKYKRVLSELEVNNNGLVTGIVLSQYLLEQSKEKILERVLHEVIHYAMYKQGKAYRDGDKDFENELRRFGLGHTSTGGLTEGWADLHTYICAECKNIMFLKENKIPKKQDPAEQGYLTGCCHAPFIYKGKIRYTNKKLQEIRSSIRLKNT